MANNSDKENNWVQTAGDTARGAWQGATMGFGENISAGVKSVVKGTKYADELKSEENANEAALQRNPVAYSTGFAGGTAGSLMIGTGEIAAGARVATAAGKTAISTASKILPKAETIGKVAGKVADKAGGIATGMFDTLKAAKGGIQEKILSKTEGLADKATNTFKSGMETIKAKGSELAENVAGKVSDAKEIFKPKIEKGIGAIKEKASSVLESSKEFAGNVTSKLKEGGKKAVEVGSNLVKKGGEFLGNATGAIGRLGSNLVGSLFGKKDKEHQDTTQHQTGEHQGEIVSDESSVPEEIIEHSSGGDSGELAGNTAGGDGLTSSNAIEILNKIYEALTKLNSTADRMSVGISSMARETARKDIDADIAAENKNARAGRKGGHGGHGGSGGFIPSIASKTFNAAGGIGGLAAAAILGTGEGESLADQGLTWAKGTDTYKAAEEKVNWIQGTDAYKKTASAVGSVWDKGTELLGFGGGKSLGSLDEGEKAHKALFPGTSKGEEQDMMMGGYKKGKYTPSIIDKAVGAVSQKYESGKSGAGTVSTGKGDFGGASYGTYQLASSGGGKSTLNKFLNSSGYAKEFQGLTAGSKEFNEKWKEIASKDEKFGDAQHEFIKQSHFDPQMEKLQKSGIDLSKSGRAVQEAVWSTSVQFGGSTGLIEKALAGKDASKMSDADIVSAIQDYKIANNDKLFKSSSGKVKEGTLSRASKEKADLLQVAASKTENVTATPLMDKNGPQQELKLAAMEASTVIPEKPQSENVAMMQGMMSGISKLSQSVMGSQVPQKAPQQVASAPRPQAGTGGSMMAVRNDDPVLLTLTYGNVKTA
jgi:hypothetical protein